MKFEDYPIAAEVKLSLQELAYKKPTDIQFKAIPSILKGEDVMAVAQTGTGKTAAFAIPVVNLLHRRKTSQGTGGIRCVVLAPTHELALQITEVFEQLSKFTDLETVCLIGGVDQDPQIEKLKAGVDILVATPGRMFDLFSQKYIRFEKVEILVLDEADHMLDLGFIKDIRDLNGALPRNRQTLFFTATLDDKIKKVAYSLVRNAIRIQVSPKDPVAKNIDHFVAYIEADDKRFFLERLMKENPEHKFIAFVRTIVRAERVVKAMARAGLEARAIHREKTEPERREIMEAYRNNDFRLLIATDISARGIDVPDIDIVVNYDLPEQEEMYVHRVGRTGRGRNRGQAISFVSATEVPTLRQIEDFLQSPIAVLDVAKEEQEVTLLLADEGKDDWRSLMAEAEEVLEEKRKRKKGKKPPKESPKAKKARKKKAKKAGKK